MAKFIKSEFHYHGGFLTYNQKVVARFKYTPRDKGPFVTFLVKNFTVEEYFKLCETLPPSKVLATKGYISSTVKSMLKERGYPQTQDGLDKYLDDQATKNWR